MIEIFKFKEKYRDKTGARVGIIINKEVGNILTPIRVLTSSEFDASEKIRKSGLAIPELPHKIFQIGWTMPEDTLKSLKSDTRVYHSQRNRILEYSLKFPSKLSIFNPLFPNGFIVKKDVTSILVDLQIDSDVEMITIQNELGLSPSEYGKRLEENREKMENADGGLQVREPIPTLHLMEKENLFSDKLKEIADRGFNALSVSYASPLVQWSNYTALMKFFEKHSNILVHWGNLLRTWPGSIRSSLPHVMQVLGDSFAVMPRRPMVPYKVIWKKVKIFDRKSLGNLTPETYIAVSGNTLDNCSVCEPMNNDLNIFGRSYQNANLLSQATKTHETISSFNEMTVGAKSIANGEFGNYVGNKKFLDIGLQRILRINARQQKLSRF